MLHVNPDVDEGVGTTQRVLDVLGNPEVADLDLPGVVHEDVLGFDVAVDLVFDLVDVVKAFEDLRLVEKVRW